MLTRIELESTLQYFSETDGAPERIGKVIGDIFATLVVLMVL